MAVEIGDSEMRSTVSGHTAKPSGSGWRVSWLPGRVLNRNEAITSVVLADEVATGLVPEDSRWPALDSWARELGLSGPEAVVRVSTSDAVREHIAQAEAAEAAQAAADAGAVPMTGPVETDAKGVAWSVRVDAAVHGADDVAPAALDHWMQAHAASKQPHVREAELVTAWECRRPGQSSGAAWDDFLGRHTRFSGAATRDTVSQASSAGT